VRADRDSAPKLPNSTGAPNYVASVRLCDERPYANVGTARSLRQPLADAGHVVDYTEVPEGHSAGTRTTRLRSVLASLFGPA
jgi:hypothetical protein